MLCYSIATLIYRRDTLKKPVIYHIVNLVNGNFYVGSTNNQRERFRTHRNKLRGSKHHCAHLQAAWNKYGEALFLFRVVEEVADETMLQAAEDVWLAKHVGESNCYNHGRRSGAPWRGVPKELHPNFGKKLSNDQKALIRTARLAQPDPRLGKQHSEETKRRISELKLANPSKYWQGKERSAETKTKIGDAQRGVAKGPRTFTPDGLERARANMRRNARPQLPAGFDEVHAKFPVEVQERYDFSNAVYLGALVRITGIFCEQHGLFSQYSAQLRKGSGCPACGAVLRAASKKAQMLKAWDDEEQRTKMLDARKSNKLLAPTPNP